MSRCFGLVFVCVLASCGKDEAPPAGAAASPQPPAGPSTLVDAAPNPVYPAQCKAPPGQECTCNSNSPLVNQFPLMGLRASGECTPQGVQLVHKSLNGAGCANATLDLEGDMLVGRDESGAVVCKGKELEGSSFEVRSHTMKLGKIKIKTIDEIADLDGSGSKRPAYLMVDAQGRSLCDPDASNSFLTDTLGISKPVPSVGAAQDLRVIAVKSELYDANGHYIDPQEWSEANEDWLHLACVDDALAKRSRYKYPVDTSDRSRAVLMMFTASYCGFHPQTVRGIEFSRESTELLEARWNADGATCVGEPRLLHDHYQKKADLPSLWPPVPPCLLCWFVWEWRWGSRNCFKNGKLVEQKPQCETCKGAECNALTSWVWIKP